jgi:hypothetical protein
MRLPHSGFSLAYVGVHGALNPPDHFCTSNLSHIVPECVCLIYSHELQCDGFVVFMGYVPLPLLCPYLPVLHVFAVMLSHLPHPGLGIPNLPFP